MNYVSNIDTICILIDVEDYENNCSNLLEYLELEREKAKLAVTSNASAKHLITLNEMAFQLLPNGSQGYSYILHNEGYEVKIAQFRSKLKALCPIQLRISSELLWSAGVTNSWDSIYNWFVETFGNITSESIFRLDLCTHTSGIDFITDNEISYKGHFKKTHNYYTNRNINALTFGSRKNKKIYCRIYNKSLEIQETNKKLWFRDIWESAGLDINNVWNLEFEIKSELLRRFNIYTINDIVTHIKDLWEYCTKKWLLKIDRTNTRVDRCDISSDWLYIQNAYSNYKSIGLIEREKQQQFEADALVPNIIGGITSYSARKGAICIDEAFNYLYEDAKRYLNSKNTDFTDSVVSKQILIGKAGVKKDE
jgi:hypothetical protein